MASYFSQTASQFVCPTVTGMQGFDATQYMGLWYQQHHVKNQPYGGDWNTCTTGEYSALNTDTLSFKVENTAEPYFYFFGYRFGIEGTGTCPTPGLGECMVAFRGRVQTRPNYFVIDTDYTSYSVVYSCDQRRDFTFLYYLTRAPVASDETMAKMQSIAETNLPDFDFDRLAPRDIQGDMCTYPTPATNLILDQ